MEKKDDLLNQLAVITDLIDKLDAKVQSPSIAFEVSKMEFERVFDEIQKKTGRKRVLPKNTFTISIGNTDIIFNTNNA